MPFPTIYRVHAKCREEQISELVFEGTLNQMIRKYGPKDSEADSLKPFTQQSKDFTYSFSVCINYRWKTIADPRPGGK